jgi:hypothetical protein
VEGQYEVGNLILNLDAEIACPECGAVFPPPGRDLNGDHE